MFLSYNPANIQENLNNERCKEILIIGMLALLTPKFSHRAVPAPDMHISMPKKNPTMQGQVTICTAGVAFLLVPPAGVF